MFYETLMVFTGPANVASHFIKWVAIMKILIQDAATVQVILINEILFRAIKFSEGLV